MESDGQQMLKIPPRFVSYLEKHRIYELFKEIVEDLVVQRPRDHVSYIRQALARMQQYRDRPRLLILAPPHIDLEKIAERFCEITGALPVARADINMLSLQNNEEVQTSETFAHRVNEVLRTNHFLEKGWILVDFPKTFEEAIMLQRAGVYPTHVIQLVPSVLNKTENLTSEAAMIQSRAQTVCGIKEYRRQILPLREAYKNVIQEIDVRGMSLEQLCDHIALQVRLSAHSGAPFLPRLVLLGLRGSGRRRLANLLSQYFNIVHVEFDEEIQRTLQNKPELVDQTGGGKRTNDNVINAIIEDKLLSWDCLSRGWVLTGFPRTLQEFRVLDLTDTPPNRVVLLDISPEMALKHTSNIRYNVDTWSRHNLLWDSPESGVELAIHPEDRTRVVQEQITAFMPELERIVAYCGSSLIILDSMEPEHKLFNMLSTIISKQAPAAPPRKPLS